MKREMKQPKVSGPQQERTNIYYFIFLILSTFFFYTLMFNMFGEKIQIIACNSSIQKKKTKLYFNVFSSLS